MKILMLPSGHKTFLDDEDYRKYKHLAWRMAGNYVAVTVVSNGKRRNVYLHRLITNAPEGFCVDHINRDPLDNRKKNLRICTPSENSMNKQGWSNTGVKGIHKTEKGVYLARYKGKHLGTFYDLDSARMAYNEKAISEYPDYAYVD